MRDGAVLLGPASIDRYIDEGRVLPGGGALNMAYHWAQRSVPFHFLTRIGDDHPALFTDFLLRHGIAHLPQHLVAPGASASIEIVIRDDRQPWMDNFVEGVWASLHLSADEERLITGARHLHAVLVDPDDVSDRFGELRMPVLALAGADDYVLAPDAAALLAARAPHARIVHVPGDHVTPVEQPIALEAELRGLLARG